MRQIIIARYRSWRKKFQTEVVGADEDLVWSIQGVHTFFIQTKLAFFK